MTDSQGQKYTTFRATEFEGRKTPKKFFDGLKPFKDLVSDDVNEATATDLKASEGS